MTIVKLHALTYSNEWSKENHISLRKSIDITNRLAIDDVTIETVKEAKFLGVTIDSHLTFEQHINQKVIKARKLIGCLLNLEKKGLHPKSLIKLYTTKIRPILIVMQPQPGGQ